MDWFIAAVGWYITLFVFGSLHVLPFAWPSIAVVTIALFGLNFFLFRKKKVGLNLRLLLFEEFLFLISFFFLVYTRGQEPSVRGLEKFMDFGFMNSIIRSK